MNIHKERNEGDKKMKNINGVDWITIDEAANEIGHGKIRPEYLLDICKQFNFPVKEDPRHKKPALIKKETFEFIKAKFQRASLGDM